MHTQYQLAMLKREDLLLLHSAPQGRPLYPQSFLFIFWLGFVEIMIYLLLLSTRYKPLTPQKLYSFLLTLNYLMSPDYLTKQPFFYHLPPFKPMRLFKKPFVQLLSLTGTKRTFFLERMQLWSWSYY